MRNSALRLFGHALTGHRHWPPFWRERAPERIYDVVIVGGGGHGLATAYYLASQHGVKRIAILEKRWLGSGNSSRNTQSTRANYFHAATTFLLFDGGPGAKPRGLRGIATAKAADFGREVRPIHLGGRSAASSGAVSGRRPIVPGSGRIFVDFWRHVLWST